MLPFCGLFEEVLGAQRWARRRVVVSLTMRGFAIAMTLVSLPGCAV